MNYLGLDWGESKIGLATGSNEISIASPLKTLVYSNSDELFEQLTAVIESEMIDMVVVGRPVSLSGDIEMSRQLSAFVEAVKTLGVVVELIDERMSTKEAQKLLQGTGSKDDDVIAATIILQSYLDKKKNG